ncbi:MAG: branched-chain amino acid transaminase [bacterium]
MFKTEETYTYFQGKIVPFHEAKVSVMCHAFNYGTGFFGGIRGNWNEEEQQLYIFRLEQHYKRLSSSSRLLLMKFHEKVSFEMFENVILDVVKKSNIKSDVYIRPLVYKSSDIVGVRLNDLEDDWTVYLAPLGDYVPLTGIRCCSSSWRRISDNAISARGKITGSYANSAFSKSEALMHGFDEAIVLDQNGFVVEGSAENLFIVREGTIITPNFSSDILEGITRKTILQLAQDHGIPIVERSIGRTEIYYADELFLCGTGAKVCPVIEVDYRKIGDGTPGPIATRLQKLYFDTVKGKIPQYKNWLTPVY